MTSLLEFINNNNAIGKDDDLYPPGDDLLPLIDDNPVTESMLQI